MTAPRCPWPIMSVPPASKASTYARGQATNIISCSSSRRLRAAAAKGEAKAVEIVGENPILADVLVSACAHTSSSQRISSYMACQGDHTSKSVRSPPNVAVSSAAIFSTSFVVGAILTLTSSTPHHGREGAHTEVPDGRVKPM